MSIDFKQEVESRREALMEDLFSLLRINSEKDMTQATDEFPFGPGPVAAMKKMLEIADRDGFKTNNVDNYVGEFEYGDGEEVLGIFAHMDVVPAGSGWDSNPYEPEIRDGKLYARGSSDDKGPTVAAYYGLKIIKDLGLPISKKIKFIIGTDEESGWGDMNYYFTKAKKPDFGFSPDATFPIINGEKGINTQYLHFGGANEGDFVLHSFKGGLRENMVPESATAVFSSKLDLDTIAGDFEAFKTAHKVTGGITEENGKFTIELIGKSAHGASPHLGVNGATFLAHFLKVYGFASDAKNFLHVAGEFAWHDHEGKKLGVAIEDEKMGKLSSNPGVFSFEEGEDNTIAVNFRYPKNTSVEDIKAKIEATLGDMITKVEPSTVNQTPHYVPMEDPLVSTLLAVYEEHTGQKGYEQVIGGGTFGRLMERGVAFGAMFPGYTDTMHQANEFTDVEDLYKAAVIYADAIYRLAK
ncbi:MAG: dipeptidase PepV [Streptococcaceae bacterium]|jgi:dipeptidase PepV|nr:dipeptidase PepV [Streptococcaceae bacterium]